MTQDWAAPEWIAGSPNTGEEEGTIGNLFQQDASWSPQTGGVTALEQASDTIAQAAKGKNVPGGMAGDHQRPRNPKGSEGAGRYRELRKVPGVPKAGPVSKKLPYVGPVLGMSEVGSYLSQDRPGEAATAAAGTGGGIAGGIAGAQLGGTLGVPFAPYTYGLSIPVMAALGSVGGAYYGDKAMRELSDAIQSGAPTAARERAYQSQRPYQAPLGGRPGRRFEHKERALVTENQYKRFQKLAGIEADKSKMHIDEGIVAGVLGGLGILLVHLELKTRLYGDPSPRPLTAIGNMLGNAIERLKATAQSKAQQGDPTLDSILDQAEVEGQRLASRFDEEQLARIQEELSDDKQLAEMLIQLGEAPPEAYEQVLSQIEQYIKSKL